MNWKKFLTSKGISEEDFAKKTVEEMAALRAEFDEAQTKELRDELAKAATKESLTTVENKIDNFLATAKDVSDEVIKELKGTLKTQGETITKLKEAGKGLGSPIKGIGAQIKDHIEANKEAFQALKDYKGASMGFTIKVAGTILTGTNLTPAANRIARTETEAGRVGFVRRNPFILDLVNVSSTNAKIVYWVELVNEDGTVAMTAEGAAKSQIDYDYVENNEAVKKVTAYMKASKEMIDDVDNFVADVEAELTERIRLFVDDQLLTGDGTGNNLTGIDANATPFAAGSTLSAAVNNAQEADVLRAAIAQVVRSEFYPSHIVLHPDMAAKIDLIKKTDDGYVIKPFMSADGMSVSGIPIVVNTNIGVDAFYVGDFSKYKVKIREDIDIQFGYENDDWTKNLITPLAEMRLVGFIPANHYGAIVTGTFTAAKAALETI